MKLSKNFTLHELTRSQTAKRYGIDNAPSPEHIENMKYLCNNGLQQLRDALGPIKISSGFRSEKLNKKVGGSSRSLHSHGCAVDIDNVNLIDIICYIHYNLPYSELIAEYFPGGWVHYGLVNGRENENILKLKDATHNYTVVTIEDILDLYGD